MATTSSNNESTRASATRKPKEDVVRLSIQVGRRHKQDLKKIAAREKLTQRKLLEYLIDSAPRVLNPQHDTETTQNTETTKSEEANTDAVTSPQMSPLPDDGMLTKGLVFAANGCEKGFHIFRALASRVREFQ